MGAYGSPDLTPPSGNQEPTSNRRSFSVPGLAICIVIVVLLILVASGKINLNFLNPTESSNRRIVYDKNVSLSSSVGRYSWQFQIYDLDSGKIITPTVSVEATVKNDAGTTVFHKVFSVSSSDYSNTSEPSCTLYFFSDDFTKGTSKTGTAAFKVTMSSQSWFDCESAISGLPVTSSNTKSNPPVSKSTNPASTQPPKTTVPSTTSAEGKTKTEAARSSTDDTVTLGMKNAVREAKSYLSVMAFSYRGIIRQLTSTEGFTEEEAKYGADNCGADWYEQALEDAKSYLDVLSFSRTGLVKQLIDVELFTEEEAEYGVNNCGADWREQAAASAKNYLEVMSFSKEGLINQLVFEGFTREEAEYAAQEAGY